MSDAEHRREPRHLLRPFEAYALPRLAAALPKWVLPDHLTIVGITSALAIGVCYALSGQTVTYLWVANLLWIVNWFGDSLDGTLARFRHIERPRYGYYLDHITDMFAAAFVCVGLGFSPYLLISVALAILIGFYLMSINVYLETYVMGVFQFGYDWVGPTEVRVILILAGSALALGFEPVIELRNIPLGTLDLLGLLGVAGMMLLLGRRIVANLGRLARLEPANVVKEPN
ncbi:MAG: CDP-alcohol phosphatidyltransferase family protein [Gemmatimonadota bacterium]|nr:MAG: CDP-alcohol phosphatidyltransferase family protein [Gemmatimonadota bacterium]